MAELSMDDLMFKPGLMKGQRILITGGGTGLGKVMAEGCALLGADVVIWGRRGGVVADTAKELSEHAAKVGGGVVTGHPARGAAPGPAGFAYPGPAAGRP